MPISPNLLDYTLEGMTGLFAEWGEKPFRARQVFRWIHQRGEGNFAAMTDLAQSLRDKLGSAAAILPPRVAGEHASADGTRKWLFATGTGNAVETVFIPEPRRGTLCVSSQVGCALKCGFCSTGRQGFNRNLTVAEMVGQLWWANRFLSGGVSRERAVTNVVLMGMGEPLLNFENVAAALEIMLDDAAYGLSRRRVTVSTSGIVPAMDRLRERCPVALAVSLHAPDDALRDVLVPINKKYPLRELLAACLRYLENAPRDFITFEYVMLEGVNDSPRHAKALLKRVAEVPCKFNLIPFNPFPGTDYRRSSPAAVGAFQEILAEGGRVATVRKTRGDDIDAACGQLAGQVEDRTRLRARRLAAVAP